MFVLDQVVPWGRSYEEYRRMFALGEEPARLRILSCADGPAGFNAEATRRGMSVISADPLYRFDANQIRLRISATYPVILEETGRNVDHFVWDSIRSVDELGRVRLQAMQTFLDDYDSGRRDGRYIDAELPTLPFADHAFDLALCSHFLFLYSDQLSEDFHLQAIHAMCCVAREVRIFPLLALGNRPSPHLPEALRQMQLSYEASVETVPYEFQRGGNQMLRIRTRE